MEVITVNGWCAGGKGGGVGECSVLSSSKFCSPEEMTKAGGIYLVRNCVGRFKLLMTMNSRLIS